MNLHYKEFIYILYIYIYISAYHELESAVSSAQNYFNVISHVEGYSWDLGKRVRKVAV